MLYHYRIMVGTGSTTELTLQGIQFLKMVFNKYGEVSEGILCLEEYSKFSDNACEILGRQ